LFAPLERPHTAATLFPYTTLFRSISYREASKEPRLMEGRGCRSGLVIPIFFMRLATATGPTCCIISTVAKFCEFASAALKVIGLPIDVPRGVQLPIVIGWLGTW